MSRGAVVVPGITTFGMWDTAQPGPNGDVAGLLRGAIGDFPGQATTPEGTFDPVVNLAALPAGVVLSAGDYLAFQVFYIDLSAPGQRLFGSEALEIRVW